jgi:hypothetical protein
MYAQGRGFEGYQDSTWLSPARYINPTSSAVVDLPETLKPVAISAPSPSALCCVSTTPMYIAGLGLALFLVWPSKAERKEFDQAANLTLTLGQIVGVGSLVALFLGNSKAASAKQSVTPTQGS